MAANEQPDSASRGIFRCPWPRWHDAVHAREVKLTIVRTVICMHVSCVLMLFYAGLFRQGGSWENSTWGEARGVAVAGISMLWAFVIPSIVVWCWAGRGRVWDKPGDAHVYERQELFIPRFAVILCWGIIICMVVVTWFVPFREELKIAEGLIEYEPKPGRQFGDLVQWLCTVVSWLYALLLGRCFSARHPEDVSRTPS